MPQSRNTGLLVALLGALAALTLIVRAIYRQARHGKRELPVVHVFLLTAPALYLVLFES